MNLSYLFCLPGQWTLKHPKIAIAALVCALVVCLGFLTRLSFEDDITKSFSSGSSYSQDYEALVSSLGFSPKQIIVLAESPEPFVLEDYDSLRNLAFEFELTDFVSSVFSLASVKFPENHARYPDAPLLPHQLNVGGIEERMIALDDAGIRVPISANRNSALYVISLTNDITELSFQPIVEKLRATAKEFGGNNLKFSFTGEDLIGPEMVSALQHDLIINNVVGSILAFVLAMLMLGNLNLVLIAVIPSLAAAFVSMATFAILNIPINVLNTVIPILILVLALADGIHLALHFRDGESTFSNKQKIQHTVTTIGPACALTAITTAVAFAAIGISDNRQLIDLAIVGAVSVLLAYIVVMMVFTLLSLLLGARIVKTTRRDLMNFPDHWGNWVLDNSRRLYAICALIAFVALAGLTNIYPWFNLDENLPSYSAVRMANQKIAKDFGGIYRIWSEIDVSGDNRLDTENGWNRLVSVTKSIEAAAPDNPVISLATISRWQGQPERMPSTEQLDEVPPELMLQLLSKDKTITRVITVVPEAMYNQKAFQTQNRIEQEAMSAGALRNIGLPIIMRYESVSVVIQLCFGLGFACFISVVLVAGFYRWPMLAAALFVPNVLPLAVAAASLTLTHNGELTPTAMLALTVAFGIAIDDSIHLVNRFHCEIQNGHSIDQALNISMHNTGKAMLMTTILVCTGMMVTMVSSFETIRLFGGMLILTFITALFADLFLLPCLLRAMAAKL